MNLEGYIRAVRKNWWICLICLLLGGAGGVLVNSESTPRYQSSVTFYVSTPTDVTGTLVQGNQFATQRIQSYASLLTSDALAKAVSTVAATGLPYSAIRSKISASVDLNTVLLTAVVTDTSADRSLKIAKGIAAEFDALVNRLDNRTAAKTATVVLAVTSGPTLNPIPISPRKPLNIGLGIALGLLVGLGLAVLRELLDNTIRTTDALRSQSVYPVLGSVAYDSAARKAPLITAGAIRSVRAESIRQLRTNLQFVDIASPVHVLVVTSSVANEGKSSTATNLAIAFAESSKRVLLLEADLRRPRVSDYLGLEGSVGLTNLLAGQVELSDVLQPWGDSGLTVLPSGSLPPNPSELLGSSNMAQLIATLRQSFDMVVVDTPPLLPVTDAVVASVHADGVVVVVRHGSTTRRQLSTALRSLEAVDARILGCVLNMIPRRGPDGRAPYDGYGYYEKSAAAQTRTARSAPATPTRPAVRVATTGPAPDGAPGQHVPTGEVTSSSIVAKHAAEPATTPSAVVRLTRDPVASDSTGARRASAD